MAATTAIRATEATLKSFLGMEASAATAISAAIQSARRQADPILSALVLEDAIEEIGGEKCDENDHFAWIVRGGLTLYFDKKLNDFFVGAM
jgi:hypothetical protein